MWHFLSLPTSLALLSYAFAHTAQPLPRQDDGLDHNGMQSFVSRPDIEPARWNIQVYDKARLAPGYWFVSPYEKNGYRLPGGSWIGPHIYDGNGELVWSGSHMFNRINVMDFKVINVGGHARLSMLYAVEGNAYILDNHYRVQDTVFTGETGVTFNMHDFRTVEDGSRYLYLQRNITEASRKLSMDELGFDGMCKVAFPGFEEREVSTKEKVQKWDGTGHIPFTDSTMAFGPVETRCRSYWDYLHSNAIDKFHDGHYLLSARHSDTLYKISKDDGSVIWRLYGLGGDRSDFQMNNVNFSRQHHARLREHNDTHTVISLLDNALGADPQPASSKWSRAIQFALRHDTSPMTAEMISSIDHPKHGHAFRRGSHQILPNGNTFVGWSERALQSEHAPDGTLLMEAELESTVLGTYRAFKFPFVAAPDYPPDIHSRALPAAEDKTITQVHVSWNGATEVATWILYKTDAAGKRTSVLATVPRAGFETAIDYDGYARYVYVKAVDRDGRALDFGQSETIETLVSGKLSSTAVAAEMAWLQEGGNMRVPSSSWLVNTIQDPVTAFIAGVVCGCVVFVFFVLASRGGLLRRVRTARAGPKYARVAVGDAAEYDEATLDDLTPRTYRSVADDDDVFKVEDEEYLDEEEEGSRTDLKTPSTERSSGG